MLTEKEKLEEELKLLQESLDLDVITKEEYEYAKQRIESKLSKSEALEQKKEEAEAKEEEKLQVKKEVEEAAEKEIEIKELTEEKEEPFKGEQKKLEEIEEEEKLIEKAEVPEEKPVEEARKEEEKEPEVIFEEEIKINKKMFVYVAIVLILVIGSWYFFFSGKSSAEGVSVESPAYAPISLIACSSDEECNREGSIGTCLNPGTENAECQYIEDAEIKLMILNSNNCFNCDTGRVLSILNGFFPNLNIKNIDFETEEGKKTAERFNINALPAYILNSSFKEAYNYDKFSSSFNEANGNFVMKNTVANANYYIEREEIPNKLDLVIKQGQVASSEAEENLKEFLEAFDENVNFGKHNENDEIVKELGINTFPTFLVNNKIKFSGVQPADKIRENFCQLNSVAECALGLTKSLV